MKQRFTLFIATLILSVCFPLTALAYDVVVDGIYYNLVPQIKTAVVTSGDNKYTGEITIPKTITVDEEVYNVTSIGEKAFYYCESLTSVTIPNSVTSIGKYAFDRCSSLTSVTIPNSVTSIEWRAFAGCSSLTSITIPNSVTSIGYQAFYECTSLTSVTIPNSVTSIDSFAFGNCSSLTSVTIPNSVTSIGGFAFLDCTSLTSVTIPNSVTSLGEGTFIGCSSLTSVTIPNSVTYIGKYAFSRCPSLSSISVDPNNTIYDSRDNCNAIIRTSNNALIVGCQSTIIPNSVTSIGNYAFCDCSSLTSVTIPNSVTSIGEEAFRECSSLTSVTIPNSVTSIGEYAFAYCSSLTSVTIPNSVTSIEWAAFAYCSSLTSVTIPNSVTSIGGFAFGYCENLENVYCYAETVPNTETRAFGYSDVESATLYVPASAIDSYKTTSPWSKFGTIKTLEETTNINSVPKRGIAIQTAAGFITISGLDDNEKVDFYTLNGTTLGVARATNGVATFSAQSGSVLIVRIGNESVKIIVE